jgi:hypothetical protein
MTHSSTDSSLVERLRNGTSYFWPDTSITDFSSLMAEAADRISTLERELEEARALVTEANNSLYGSQGYFYSLNGGPFDKYHLSTGIENLKSACNSRWHALTAAEAKVARMGEALEQLAPFAKWAIRESAFSGHELDGGEVQEKALANCLIVRTVYDPQQHGPSDVASAGDEWFEFSSTLAEPQP